MLTLKCKFRLQLARGRAAAPKEELRQVDPHLTSSMRRMASLCCWMRMGGLSMMLERSSIWAHRVILGGTTSSSWIRWLQQLRFLMLLTQDCQALFIFDQSSAHASLPPDALQAFDMNKSNGRKQRKQHDTVIPQTNPDPQFRGQVQKMTTLSGEAKGFQAILEEHRF